MKAGDPERLKNAIVVSSSVVAKARSGTRRSEGLYIRFHEIATDRKLLLASRGFEVPHVSNDEMYDLAVAKSVPTSEWGEFVQQQLPMP